MNIRRGRSHMYSSASISGSHNRKHMNSKNNDSRSRRNGSRSIIRIHKSSRNNSSAHRIRKLISGVVNAILFVLIIIMIDHGT